MTYHIVDDSDHQAAAGADSDVLLLTKVIDGDLKAIPTRAGIVVDLESLIKGHILDLNLIVDRNSLLIHVEYVVRCTRLQCTSEEGRTSKNERRKNNNGQNQKQKNSK